MPTYDYRCTICDEEFEVVQSFVDDTLTSIDGKDHQHTVKKVFSPVSIAFKGSGFYKNDSSTKTSSAGSEKSASTTSSSDSGSPKNGSKSGESVGASAATSSSSSSSNASDG